MSVNTVNFQQIGQLMTNIVAQAGGKNALANINTKDFTSVAQVGLSLPLDSVLNTLTGGIGRTVFATRPYSARFKGLEKSLYTWGAYMRKLSIADTDWEDDPAYSYPVTYDASQNPPTGDGLSVDQWKIKKPNILQTVFTGSSVYQDHMTITKKQLQTAFQNETEFGSFVNLLMTGFSNKLERSKDGITRGLVANMITALVAEAGGNSSPRVVKLLTEYNAETGSTLSATDVYLPENFAPFMKWAYARIAQISSLMEESSVMYQTVINNKPVYRHTEAERQKIYLFAKQKFAMEARVLADTYHDNYLTRADVETVNFWQSIQTPGSVTATPAYTSAAGVMVEAAQPVTVNNIFGIMFDEDAAGYSYTDQEYLSTPINAAGAYYNIWLHARPKVFMDLSEKCVLLLLE